jgi:hypothetical protein
MAIAGKLDSVGQPLRQVRDEDLGGVLSIFDYVRNLARGNVHHELAKLDWIARSRGAF